MAIYEVEVKNIDKLDMLLKDLNNVMQSLKGVKKGFKSLDNVKKGVDDGSKSVKEITKQLEKMDKKMFEMVGIEGMLDKWKEIKTVLTGTTKAFLKNIGGAIKVLTLAAGKLAIILAVVGAISSVVMIIKKAFQYNIGGLQATFRRLQAIFKRMKALFQVNLIKMLKKLEPMFQEAAKFIEDLMDIMTSTDYVDAVMGLLETIANLMRILMPVFTALMKVLLWITTQLLKLVNSIFSLFGLNSGSSNSTTNNDNKTINYYSTSMPGNYGMGSMKIEEELMRTP